MCQDLGRHQGCRGAEGSPCPQELTDLGSQAGKQMFSVQWALSWDGREGEVQGGLQYSKRGVTESSPER